MTATAVGIPGRPVWLRGYGGVGTPSAVDCHHVCHLSLTAGVRALALDGATMLATAVTLVLLLTLGLVGRWWWRRTTRSPVPHRRAVAAQPVDLDGLRGQIRREFVTVAGIAAAVPPDASLCAEVPLLADQIGIAAHSTDRLLSAVTQARVDAPVAYACVERARRIAAAVIGLHTALLAATRQPSSVDAARVVATAVDELDAAVDGLYIEVTTAVPPHAGHGDR